MDQVIQWALSLDDAEFNRPSNGDMWALSLDRYKSDPDDLHDEWCSEGWHINDEEYNDDESGEDL